MIVAEGLCISFFVDATNMSCFMLVWKFTILIAPFSNHEEAINEGIS